MSIETRNYDCDMSANALRTYSGVAGGIQFDLRSFSMAIWRGKWFIASLSGVFVVVTLMVNLWLANEYKAEVLLLPADSTSTPSLARIAGQFGGLAALAGIDVGGGGSSDKAAIAIKLLKSWGFLDQFIRENDLEVEVFAAKGWDRVTNRVVIDPNLYDVARRKWIRPFDASNGESAEPSSWELYKALKDKISVEQDKSTGLITLGCTHYSPELAKSLVDKLVVSVNAYLREQDQREARRSIEYLHKQLDQTSLSEMQKIFYTLIEDQTKTLMLTEVSEEYVLKTLSDAKVPQEKAGPKRILNCVLAALFGMLLSVFTWLTFLDRARTLRNSESA